MTGQLIVADIGGTNARFAIAERHGDKISITDAQSFRAVDFETIRDAADAFLESVGATPSRGCFAAAGPLTDKGIKFTNSHWDLQPDEISTSLGLREFSVVNDFHALAAGTPYLPSDGLTLVKDGTPDQAAPIIVVGPGTGLGQALIVPTSDGHKIVTTEGGHVSFAPRSEEEFKVMQFIAREHPRVSVERLLSGRGLVNIHRALCALADTPRISLQADEITIAAIERTHPIAGRAVDMFCSLLGQVVGDAVLATGARGGVLLGGGILPKIETIFHESAFVDKFLDKGRMSKYVENVPVSLIVKEGAGLYGAAAIAGGQT